MKHGVVKLGSFWICMCMCMLLSLLLNWNIDIATAVSIPPKATTCQPSSFSNHTHNENHDHNHKDESDNDITGYSGSGSGSGSDSSGSSSSDADEYEFHISDDNSDFDSDFDLNFDAKDDDEKNNHNHKTSNSNSNTNTNSSLAAEQKNIWNEALMKSRQSFPFLVQHRNKITFFLTLFAFRREIMQFLQSCNYLKHMPNIKIEPSTWIKLILCLDLLRKIIMSKKNPYQHQHQHQHQRGHGYGYSGGGPLGYLLREIKQSHSYGGAYNPPIVQHYMFERLNDRHVKDTLALQKALYTHTDMLGNTVTNPAPAPAPAKNVANNVDMMKKQSSLSSSSSNAASSFFPSISAAFSKARKSTSTTTAAKAKATSTPITTASTDIDIDIDTSHDISTNTTLSNNSTSLHPDIINTTTTNNSNDDDNSQKIVIVLELNADAQMSQLSQLRDTVSFLLGLADSFAMKNANANVNTANTNVNTANTNVNKKQNQPFGQNPNKNANANIKVTHLEIVLLLESPGGVASSYGLASSQLQRLRHYNRNRNSTLHLHLGSHNDSIDNKHDTHKSNIQLSPTPTPTPTVTLTICVDKVAASGGYMMACQASPQSLLAAPFAMIGSIGVVSQAINFHSTLRNWGVKPLVFKAPGEGKAPITAFNEVTKEGMQVVQSMVDRTHEAFQQMVLQGRGDIIQPYLHQISTGEIWMGEEALKLALVDRIITSDQYLDEQMRAGHLVLKLHRCDRGRGLGLPLSHLLRYNNAHMNTDELLHHHVNDNHNHNHNGNGNQNYNVKKRHSLFNLWHVVEDLKLLLNPQYQQYTHAHAYTHTTT